MNDLEYYLPHLRSRHTKMALFIPQANNPIYTLRNIRVNYPWYPSPNPSDHKKKKCEPWARNPELENSVITQKQRVLNGTLDITRIFGSANSGGNGTG